MYFFTSLRMYLCILKYMTLVSCNLVHITLKVVWAEIPAVCFCVKYHTARLPEPHRGRPDQATGHLLTPPLEKTNSLTMKHLSPPPPLHTSTPLHCVCFFLFSFTTPLPTFSHCSFLWTFPVFQHQPFLINCVSLDVFVYRVPPSVYLSGNRPRERNSTTSSIQPMTSLFFLVCAY